MYVKSGMGLQYLLYLNIQNPWIITGMLCSMSNVIRVSFLSIQFKLSLQSNSSWKELKSVFQGIFILVHGKFIEKVFNWWNHYIFSIFSRKLAILTGCHLSCSMIVCVSRDLWLVGKEINGNWCVGGDVFIHKSYTLPVLDLLWYFASSLITGIQGLIVIVGCENLTWNFGQYFWYHRHGSYWHMYISLFVLNDIEIVASSQEQICKSPRYFKWFIACTCIALAAAQPWWRTRTRCLEIICKSLSSVVKRKSGVKGHTSFRLNLWVTFLKLVTIACITPQNVKTCFIEM